MKMIITNLKDFKPFKAVDGSEIVETIGLKTTGTKEISLARAVVKPNSKTLEHNHTFLEIYLIEQGNGQIKINSKIKDIRKGDSILIPKKSWHTVENTGKKDLLIWCVCKPAFSEYYTEIK
ncbi:MAG: cupin domain-containing protein [Candidatus Bathyarchaeota archaeon]